MNKFLKDWTIDLGKIPAYTAFKSEFSVELDYPLLTLIAKSDNEFFTEDRKKLLLPVIEATNPQTGVLKIKHNNRFNMGRFYPNNSISPICVSRHIKHTLFHYLNWIDLDMVKGHPSILYSLAKNNGLTLSAFKKYIDQPALILSEMQQFYSVEDAPLTTDDCKSIFNIKIYGGSHKTWLEQMGQEGKEVRTTDIHPFEVEFEKECRIVMDVIYHANQNIKNVVKGDITNEYKLKTKVMSYFCGTIENDILFLCYKYLCKMGIITEKKNVLLEYDGLCFKNPQTPLADILDQLNFKIKTELKLDVKMAFKKYNENHIALDVIEARNKLKEESKVAIEAEKQAEIPVSEEIDKVSFETVAEEFEQQHCKIINKGIFIKQLGNDNIVMSEKHLRTSYNHLIYKEYNTIKNTLEPRNFISDWLNNNPTQRCYDDVGVYPNPEKCPSNHLNLWRKFEMEMVTEYEHKQEALDIILNHIRILCNNEETVYNYFIAWIAQMVQFPAIKSTSPTLISKEGAGKGTLIRLIEKMFGQSKVFETTTPSRDVWGDFNNHMANSFLVVLDELSKKETTESEGKIKGLITSPRLCINNKGVNKYEIDSFHRFIITTNNEEPIATKKDDRRKFIIRSSDEKIGDKEYFNKLYEYLDDVNVVKTCYEFFKSQPDIKDFNKLQMPCTEYQAQLQEMATSPIEQWLQDFTAKNQGRDIIELKSESILERFNEWAIENGVEYNIDSMKLMVRLARLKINGVTKRKSTHGINVTVFDIKLMSKHFGIGLLL